MGFSLFPKAVKFYDMFREQNRNLVKAAAVLDDLCAEFTDVEEKCTRINIIESDGNRVSREISRQLSLTFITPIDREDIHELNLKQEELLNLIKAISTRIGLYDLDRIRYPARRIANLIRQISDETSVMLDKLGTNKDCEKNAETVKALKYECEMLLLVALAEIYETEDRDPGAIMGVVKWTHIYDRFEMAVNAAEALADIIEGITLKNA